MAIQQVEAVPELLIDDGVAFIFSVTPTNGTRYQCGFLHWPLEDPTGKPPVTNLSTWVETLKYGSRNNANVRIVLDDAITINYNAWWGSNLGFLQVNIVTGLPINAV